MLRVKMAKEVKFFEKILQDSKKPFNSVTDVAEQLEYAIKVYKVRTGIFTITLDGDIELQYSGRCVAHFNLAHEKANQGFHVIFDKASDDIYTLLDSFVPIAKPEVEQIITNYENFKGMSLDEMAEFCFLSIKAKGTDGFVHNKYMSFDGTMYNTLVECINANKQWLNSEAK